MILFGIVSYHTIPFSRVKSRFLTVGSQIDEINYWWQSRAIKIIQSSVFRSSSQRKGEKAKPNLIVLRSLEDRRPFCLKVWWWRMATCLIRVPADTDPSKPIGASFSIFLKSYYMKSISRCLAFYLLSCVWNLSTWTCYTYLLWIRVTLLLVNAFSFLQPHVKCYSDFLYT